MKLALDKATDTIKFLTVKALKIDGHNHDEYLFPGLLAFILYNSHSQYNMGKNVRFQILPSVNESRNIASAVVLICQRN